MTDSPSEEFDFEAAEQDVNPNLPGGLVAPAFITPEMLRKRVMWDVVPCSIGQDVVSKLGMSPASDDVEEMEHHESHDRLESVLPLVPLIQQISIYAAQAIRGAMMVEHGDEIAEVPFFCDELLAPALYQASWATLAELVDTGFLHVAGPVLRYVGNSE